MEQQPAVFLHVDASGLFGELPPARPAQDNWSVTWPQQDVALLHLSSFAVPRWQQWWKAKPEEREPFLAEGRAGIDAIIATLRERNARALILDVRGNGGGTDLLGIHLAERLLAGEFRYFQLSSCIDGRWQPPGALTYGKGEHPRFPGKVIALVDDGCFSTTDNFLRCLDDLHTAFTAVGRPSGRGTEPDVAVTWKRADWLAGRDPDLEAALRIAGPATSAR